MEETREQLTRVIPTINNSSLARDLMEVFPRTIEFRLDGEQRPFFVTIDQSQMSITEEASREPDLIVVGDTRGFARVVRREIDVTHLIARGELIVTKGRVSEMTLLNRILWATRRR